MDTDREAEQDDSDRVGVDEAYLEEVQEVGSAYANPHNLSVPLCVRVSERIHRGRRRSFRRLARAPRPPILIVEDDAYLAGDYAGALEAAGYDVSIATSAEEARSLAAQFRQFVAVILDIKMRWGSLYGELETARGYRTGLLLGEDLLNDINDVPFIALTNSDDPHVQARFDDEENRFHFCNKINYPPEKFAKFVQRALMPPSVPPQAFIVHGHDQTAMLELKNYLQNRLGFPEPIILGEKASGTQTVIEKFEKYSEKIDVVFVLLTPDDVASKNEPGSGRARQNVVFELGYFVGRFGRKSGRVILLAKKGLEMMSDLSGVLPIDITEGIEAAGEKIRLELEGMR